MYRTTIWCLMCLLLIVSTPVARAEEKSSAEEARIAALDKGPSKIDVSKYPDEMKANYKAFTGRCGGKCHGPARAINSTFALPEEWERYVKRMMRKPGSGIAPEEGKKIFDFLKYDSSVRKKDLIERKLKEQQGESGK